MLLIPLLSAAQDSAAVKSSRFGIALYADYGKPLEVLVTNQTKWELGLGLIISNKMVITGEYGYANLIPENVINNGSYNSEGNYYRLGLEYMFSVAPRRYLSLGSMYASTTFNDAGTVEISSELWQGIAAEFSRSGLSAQWIEIILNTEAPLFRVNNGFFSNFYWGSRIRLRLMMSDLTQPDFDVFAVPGYGKTYSSAVPAFNLFLKYRIDF